MRSKAYSGHACPFCGTATTRILNRYELSAITGANDAADGLAAFQCGDAHVFFVALKKREPASEKPRSLGHAAGSSS